MLSSEDQCEEARENEFFSSSIVRFTNKRLCYSGQGCRKIPPVICKLYGEKAHSLDLSYNELVSLKGLEAFGSLREIVLDNNHLGDSLEIPYLPHLHTFSINKNHINDIEVFLVKLKQSLPALTFLSLLGNKACPNQLADLENDDKDYARYRCYLLSQIPNLKFLDSTKVSASERILAEKRGQFMKVVRPLPVKKPANSESESEMDVKGPQRYCSPLPRTIRSPEDHRGVYRKCKYKYSGKHSEGNRFITDNDL